MVKNKLFYLFYIFCSFTLLFLRGKEYFAKLNQWSRSRFLWPLGAGAARKKIPGAGAAWEKIQKPEPLEKKVRSRSRLKKRQEPEPLKNLPAPQPWEKHLLFHRFCSTGGRACLQLIFFFIDAFPKHPWMYIYT